MSSKSASNQIFSLPDAFVVEIAGADAAKVANNLTTNDVAKLELGKHFETFVTNVRGWTVAHCFLMKQQLRVLLMGQHPDPQSICDHIDRYIIVEDAQVKNLSDELEVVIACESALVDQSLLSNIEQNEKILSLLVPFIKKNSVILAGPKEELQSAGVTNLAVGSEQEFELSRINAFWPRMGKDILEKCIPQELDRDPSAISFTKGCYLGQETIARLDARGQLQKKLALLEIDGDSISTGSQLVNSDGKEVGTISSVAFDPMTGNSKALGMVRRGNFSVDSELTCNGAKAIVVSPPAWLGTDA